MVRRHLAVRAALAAVTLAMAGGACRQAPRTGVTAEAVTLNNRGVALMGQYDFGAAAAAFDEARAAAPAWPGATLNHAIALVNRQGSGDSDRAEAELRSIIDSPDLRRRARYVLALLLAHEGRDGEALPLLTEVADQEPPDAVAAYFAGQQHLTTDPSAALRWYEKAMARDPLLRSAYYGAFLALRRLGRDEEATRHLARFEDLARNPQARMAEFKYTRMGPLSEALLVDLPPGPVHVTGGPRFQGPVPMVADSPARSTWKPASAPRSMTVADMNGDGQLDVFIADALDGPAVNAILIGREQQWSLDTAHDLAQVTGIRAAIWGDFDDDGLADVVLCRGQGGTMLWRQESAGRFAVVSAPHGLRLPGTDIVDGAAFDADHDGDLDIWLINAAGPGILLNNDGDLRFRSIAEVSGVQGDGRPARGLAVADLDGDRDTDVMVIKAVPPHDVFLNDRVWSYRRDPGAGALAAAPITALVAGDVDADGDTELYSAGSNGLVRWRRQGDGAWRADVIAPLKADAGARLSLADTNGDGRLEVLATSGTGWRVHELLTNAAGADAPQDGRSPGGWVVAHLDARVGPSIIGVGDDGAPIIWRPGPGRHEFVGLALSGLDPSSDQRRSNVSGIGTRVAVRTGSRWTAFDTTRLASGPGQSLQPMTIGLGGAPRADFVALTWSDGVFQTELGLEAGRLHRIAETQRQLSSCPVLFAWDGSAFRFVTDLLGVGGLGFFEQPGRYAEPLPRENVRLPDGVLTIDDGAYRLKVAEPMEEVTYLDRVSLVAYDLPPGWRMALDERKAISGPTPTGEPIFYREERMPIVATDHEGRDVTPRVLHADLTAAGPRRLRSRFIGLAEPHALVLTFAQPIDQGPGRPVLVVDGWIEYPYAQTMFAAWQAGLAYEAPTLEARDGSGRWRVVAREFGYPAGMPRQMAYPLPALPRGTTALRLRTSQEIYWDRVAVVYAESPPQVRRQVLPLQSATLTAGGFARRTTGPQRAPSYDDSRRVPLGDTRHSRGWYTEFGPVAALVADEDGAVAIFGPGEAVDVAFTAPSTAPSTGWSRTLVLEARGWCKDMDLYTRDGDTIEPLPGRDTPARRALHPRFNTRYASGH